MTEKDLLDLFAQERINMLLYELDQTNPKKTQEENDRLIQAEYFISHLPPHERELLQNYIDNILQSLLTEGPYLYKQGFSDALRVKKLMHPI